MVFVPEIIPDLGANSNHTVFFLWKGIIFTTAALFTMKCAGAPARSLVIKNGEWRTREFGIFASRERSFGEVEVGDIWTNSHRGDREGGSVTVRTKFGEEIVVYSGAGARKLERVKKQIQDAITTGENYPPKNCGHGADKNSELAR